MKRFVSLVTCAALMATSVPATAFASAKDIEATAKVVGAIEVTKDQAKDTPIIDEVNYPGDVPELQVKITDSYYRSTNATPETVEMTLSLDNAKWVDADNDGEVEASEVESIVTIVYDEAHNNATGNKIFNAANDGAVLSPDADGETAGDIAVADIVDLTGADSIEWLMDEAGATVDFSGVTADIYYDFDDTDSEDAILVVDATAGAFADGISMADFIGFVEEVAIGGNAAFMDAANGGNIITLGDTGYEVTVDGIVIDTNYDSTFVVTADDIIANYEANGYTRGDYADETIGDITWVATDVDEDEVTFEFTGFFLEDDKIVFDMNTELTKYSEGKTATVSLKSDFLEVKDLVFAEVVARGVEAETDDLTALAEDETSTLEEDIEITSKVGDFVYGQEFELKLSSGFEFSKLTDGTNYSFRDHDENEVIMTWEGSTTDEIVIDKDDIEIEATTAKAGDIATLTIKSIKDKNVAGTFSETCKFDIAKVVENDVIVEREEDEDLPVIYSGVGVNNYGLTDDSDHWSLEVTIEETFPGAWDMKKAFAFELPEGVFVTDVDVIETENFRINGDEADTQDWEDAFWKAYREGEHEHFEFKRRTFETSSTEYSKDPASITFKLQLIAAPTFEGEVELKVTGDAVEEQTVTIAKFVKPYVIEASQNDLIIDYRYTEVPSDIVVKEAEAGLWAKDEAFFHFEVEKSGYMQFEDEATFKINPNSEMEIDNEETYDGVISFEVAEESDDEAAVVTISNMEMYMSRDIPAGPYDLKLWTSMEADFLSDALFAPDGEDSATYVERDSYDIDEDKEDSYVEDVYEEDTIAKEAFINVVTAGREQDDATFTTKVSVTIGENKLTAGEKEIPLDVPAYINSENYTMLPIRAVANAIGVDANCVMWNAEARQITILYGQRIISMRVGERVITINGSNVPASTAVEIRDSRAFLPLRDLATALGVTDITWDSVTRTAVLNGNLAVNQ